MRLQRKTGSVHPNLAPQLLLPLRPGTRIWMRSAATSPGAMLSYLKACFGAPKHGTRRTTPQWSNATRAGIAWRSRVGSSSSACRPGSYAKAGAPPGEGILPLPRGGARMQGVVTVAVGTQAGQKRLPPPARPRGPVTLRRDASSISTNLCAIPVATKRTGPGWRPGPFATCECGGLSPGAVAPRTLRVGCPFPHGDLAFPDDSRLPVTG